MSQKIWMLPAALVLATSGCERDQPAPRAEETVGQGYESDQSTLSDPQDQKLRPAAGPVDLREVELDFKTAKGARIDPDGKIIDTGRGVRILLMIEDGRPGRRGVHIHEKADCSNIVGKSMGEHFNPLGQKHGLPGQSQRHLGDLGNIDIAKDGKGRLNIVVPEANLKKDDEMSFLGRALVIHSAEDTAQGESGGSGTPMACAEIKED
jgi:Cu-Zn family superoxide dismutase